MDASLRFPRQNISVTPGMSSFPAGSFPHATAEYNSTGKLDQDGDASEATQEELRKQRNRLHQARHIMKKRKIVSDLEESVKELREEVEELRVQHQIARLSVKSTSTIWNVVAEYFRLFRNGYTPTGTTFGNGILQPSASPAQQKFLYTSMASDVLGETGRGVESLLEDWRLISLYHEDIDIQLVRLEQCQANVLTATTKDSVAITANTLRYAFPHVVNSEACNKLASKVFGQQLRLRGIVKIEWNQENGRVVRLQYKADMLTPMLQLLGNLEDVSRLFDKALVTPDCRLVTS